MTNLMNNIINEYVDNIMREHEISELEAKHLLEEVLQDYDIQEEIMERICTIH